ncbi:flagellar hook-length control protein FliK [Anaerosporobacter sp.]|uniref:flagellar hook-length control protein FliK n=1 Tax=Anaerosporobacter sp. TaxID=1872529 RepID=UPI00289FAB59|nr:flagellar hook-length control protein FliK [Anaerosporobacter sp.]
MKANEVMSQMPTITRYQAGSKVNTGKNTDFQGIMDSNLQSREENNNSQAVDKKTSVVSQSNNKTTNSDDSKKTVNETKKSDLTDATKNVSNDKNPIEDKLNQLTTEVKNIIMDNLEITEEQLEVIMSTLGLNYLQLLEPSNLAQVFMEANGLNDPTQMLTDQLLSDQFSQLVEQIGQVDLEEMGLTTEDIALYLEKLNLNNAEDVPAEEAMVTTTVNDDSEEDVVDNQKTLNQKSTVENQDIKVEVQKHTTDSDADSSSSNKQNQDASVEHANLNTILNNVTKVNTVESFGNELVQIQQLRDIANQVVEQIKVIIKPDQTSMEMNLNPESLGKVNLVVAEKNGLLTAQFTVQNEIAKEALESQMQTLKDNFTNQGLKVDAVEVLVSNSPFSQDNMSEGSKEQQKSSGKKKNINLADLDLLEDDITEEDAMKIDIMSKNGNSVDYSA